MGRLKKYSTEEEWRKAKNAQRMDYYNRNKEVEKEKALKRYHENKKMH